MMESNYIDIDYHKELHEKLIKELSDKITHFSLNKTTPIDIIKFLTDWFIEHTVKEDIKIHQSITDKSR